MGRVATIYPAHDAYRGGARLPISKTLRFDVFKRDSFICSYCGRTPPTVRLEADHINPVAEGGSSDINNLITACFDCNRGKGAAPLTVIPFQIRYKVSYNV